MCDVKFCRKPATMTYYGKRICDFHFEEHCEGKINLKQMLEVEE